MKEEGVKKVNMSMLEAEIDLITSIKDDFAIFENSSDLPVLDYPSRLEMGMMAICLRGTTRMSIDLKEYTFGANDMVIGLADQIVQQHQRSDDFLCCVFAVSIKFAQEAILSYRQFLPTLLRIKEDPRILLNCSSIAKGYACDVIARLLEKEGVKNYMVEIGGEVTMKGVNQQGDCWRVGINKPEIGTSGVTNDVEEIVQLCQKGGVATSGDYRNFYIKDGKKYAHTINPATGYPAGQNILSATIVAEDCMTADAYATTFMVLGVEKAKLLAQSIPQIEYFIIYADNNGQQKVTYSKGMLEYLPNRKTLAILENP